jgi:gamma-glutamylcyclotransferase (GGCT)/AIG2-like uncharacterized protein YtfP
MSASLFVYGTLMRGQVAHHLVAKARRVEPAHLLGAELFALPEGYPAALESEAPGACVHGELVTFGEALQGSRLAALDRYEEVDPADPEGSLYHRVLRRVRVSDGERLAWCYLMPPSRRAALLARGARPLPSGRWAPG